MKLKTISLYISIAIAIYLFTMLIGLLNNSKELAIIAAIISFIYNVLIGLFFYTFSKKIK